MTGLNTPATTMRDLVTISIGLIDEIEAALSLDCAPPPEVIAPLAARVSAHRAAWRNPYLDDALQDDIRKALTHYGSWLELEEVHAVQRLRGWHRARRGAVRVTVGQVEDVRDVLADLRQSLDGECAETVREYGLDRVRVFHPEQPGHRERGDFREIRDSVLRSMAFDDETCGECNWCWIRRLHITCCTLLDPPRTGEDE